MDSSLHCGNKRRQPAASEMFDQVARKEVETASKSIFMFGMFLVANVNKLWVVHKHDD